MRIATRIAIQAVTCIALLEVVLQAAAFGVHLTRTRPAAPTGERLGPDADAGGGQTVLFVGDSFTYGDGASDPSRSYPSVAGEVLLSRTGSWFEIANCGVQGRNSREALLRLPEQLAREHPRIVCILLGTTDRWSTPEPVRDDTPDDSGGFVWRWRTLRLGKLLFANPGTWEERGPPRARPTTAAPTPHDLAVARQLIERSGIRRRPVAPRARTRSEPDRSVVLRRQLRRGGDASWVARQAEAILAEDPGDTRTAELLARACMRLGRRDQASAIADRIGGRFRAEGSLEAAEEYAEALSICGRWDDAKELCERLTSAHPDFYPGWRVIGRIAARRDTELAIEAYRTCLELLPEEHLRSAESVEVLKYLTRLYSRVGDASRTVALAGAFTILGHDGKLVAAALRPFGSEAATRLAELAAELGIGETGRARWRSLRSAAFPADERAYLRVLRTHLERIVALVRSHGAVPVLVSYPYYLEGVESVQREVAEDLDVPFVDARSRFDRELESRARSELFVEDGHCNDAGYALLGEVVGTALGALARDRSARR